MTRMLIAPLVLGLLAATAVALPPASTPNYLNMATATATYSTTTNAPAVTLTKTCPGLRYLGRNAKFELTVTNNGSGGASNVIVTDTIPNGLDFVSATHGGTRQGNAITWRIGNMEAGATQTMTAEFRCNTIGNFTNTARVTYCASADAECQMAVKGIPAILLECVDDPDPIEVGGSLTYTIVVTNQGTAVDTNVRIAVTLPPEEEYVSGQGPTAATANGKSITFAPLPTLAPKARAVYQVRVKGIGEGDVRFRVEMTSDNIDSPVMETESTRFYN